MRSVAWPVSCAILTLASVTGAESKDVARCIATHEAALSAQHAGKLTLASAKFGECTDPACPGPVREECASRVKDLEGRIPTVVLSAKLADSGELENVRVEIDTQASSTAVDGRALRLDPGPHTFRFVATGHPDRLVKVVLAEGDRLRRIEAIWTPTSSTIPTPAWILGGVGVLGLVGFGYFGLSGLSQESDLKKCKPTCSKSETDSLSRKYLFADLSLAVAFVGFGGATYLYVSSRNPAGTAEAGVRSGSLVGLAGSF